MPQPTPQYEQTVRTFDVLSARESGAVTGAPYPVIGLVSTFHDRTKC
ncbi:hypothetical protein [Streptomyces sp. NPDC002088]